MWYLHISLHISEWRNLCAFCCHRRRWFFLFCFASPFSCSDPRTEGYISPVSCSLRHFLLYCRQLCTCVPLWPAVSLCWPFLAVSERGCAPSGSWLGHRGKAVSKEVKHVKDSGLGKPFCTLSHNNSSILSDNIPCLNWQWLLRDRTIWFQPRKTWHFHQILRFMAN